MSDYRETLRGIRTFPQLIKFLRDTLDWPISSEDFEELTFDYTAEELGIDTASAAKIQEIKRLRPLSVNQPWGIFFIKFEPKRLPVVVMRRVLSRVALKKRASANSAERVAWQADDLLFVSNYGAGEERRICFAHFAQPGQKNDLPTLKVLGWDNLDTPLHLDYVADELGKYLAWPDDENDTGRWRETWQSAFTLRHREVITTSKALAMRLAELARGIRDRIKTVLAIETEDGPVTKLMTAFQQALVHDLDEDGFADMYAQTIAYGLLSARVANPSANTADDLAAQMPVTNPFLKELMETFLHVGGRKGKAESGTGIDFDELGVGDVIDLLDNANMEAVVRDFGDRNPQEDPVIHFYELFLKEYDAKKRMQRGVFYTPRPVVSYIVRSVDELLRTEFGLADGLADTTTWDEMAARHDGLKIPDGAKPGDPFVQILDPATGTGTFLVEVIDLIHRTMTEKWKAEGHSATKIEQLWNEYVPKHLLPRLHGYELLMAPYAIAHLKIGLKLYETGYRFGSDERARVYLTNSLEPAQDFSNRLAFAIPALAHEAQAVNTNKRQQHFTVVIGNPPYSGISCNMSDHAQRLVDAYKIVDGAALNERKLWLQDDYVKFIRTAQTTLEQAHTGVFGYITNHSYLDNPTFRGMRQSLMDTFQRMRLLDLHGNATKKEHSPDGSEDKNVFDIRQGVAICVASSICENPSVQHADLWGSREAKYDWLIAHSVRDTPFVNLTPDSPFYFFEPQNVDFREEYERGWKVTEAMPSNTTGFVTARDHFVIGFASSELLERISAFANRAVSDNAIRARYFAGKGASKYEDGDSRGWKLPEARKRVQSDADWKKRVLDCLYRPFDVRKIYWCDWMIDWSRPEVTRHLLAGENFGINIGRAGQVIDQGPWNIIFCTRSVTEFNLFRRGGNSLFPLWLYEERADSQKSLGVSGDRRLNLNSAFLRDCAQRLALPQVGSFGLPQGCAPEDIFHYAYAVFHSPGYRGRYAEFLKIDFPRLPLTSSLELFRTLARLGGELVALHLVEAPFQQALSAQYDKSAKAWRYDIDSGHRRPVALIFTGPAEPVVEKVGWADDTVYLDKAQTMGFRGVPEDVWNFHIGGYQVCEKWLKDRKGRTLSADDITHYHRIVVALHETIRLMTEIDEAIDQHGGWPDAFRVEGKAESASDTTQVPELLKVAEEQPPYGKHRE